MARWARGNLTQELLGGILRRDEWSGRFRIGIESRKFRRVVAEVLFGPMDPRSVCREGGARQGYREGGASDLVDLHSARSLGSVSRSRVRSSIITPSSGLVRVFQAGSLRVCSTSARPASQC